MAIKKRGIQTFFNPPESPDSGFLKFYVKAAGPNTIGIDCEFQIADCSRRIHLDVEPRAAWKSDGKYKATDLKATTESIKVRRAKVALMRKVFNDVFDMLDESYNALEEEIKAIPKGEIK
jgi:hypothetical protein